MNKKVRITLTLAKANGTKQRLVILGEIVVDEVKDTHDVAAILFHAEFGMNASCEHTSLGGSIRAHIFQE